MNKVNKRASIFVFVLILINVALIIWYVVFNNTYILNNNINIWKNAEEVFIKLSDKWNINIESTKQYNANWGGFEDFVSCPENITMSWTTNFDSWIQSEMWFNLWKVYCTFRYDGEEARIFLDEQNDTFSKAFYRLEMIDIVNGAFTISGTKESVSNEDSSLRYSSSYDDSRSIDGSTSTEYRSTRGNNRFIEYDLWSEKKIWKIIIKKADKWNSYWNNWIVNYYDNWNNLIKSSTLSWMRDITNKTINFSYWSYSDADDIRYIRITHTDSNKYLDIREFEVYELIETWLTEWTWDTNFTFDDTKMTFDATWIGWLDSIDDNMNSDNYRSTSTGDILY